MHCWFLIGEVLHLLQAMSRWEIRTAVLVCGWEGYRTLTMLTYTFKNMDLLLRDVTLLARRAVSAAGSPTRPARRRPTLHGGPSSSVTLPAAADRPPAALQTTTADHDKHQPAKQYLPIRRASNNAYRKRWWPHTLMLMKYQQYSCITSLVFMI